MNWDEDVRVRINEDGQTILAAMNRDGMETLTDLSCSPEMIRLEDEGKIVIKRLQCGGVYLITADEGIIDIDYVDADEEIH